jgi:phosphoribosylanthranilate isomerase
MSKTFNPLIKVCGMKDPDNIRQLLALKPDYIGFILYPASKRFLGDDFQLNIEIPLSVKKVGVFVNAPVDEVVRWVKRLKLDYVQLHGDESVEYCRDIFERNISLIKAFGVDDAFSFHSLQEFAPFCSYFLFDTKTTQRGGSGEHFDWSVLQQYNLPKPFFLSGGIGPEDAMSIKEISGLPFHAVDINSRFEDAPAMKNIPLLKNFFTELRKVNR